MAKAKRELTEREIWFNDRIGRVIWRNETTCPCEVCKHVHENGLMVKDEMHADYLCECEGVYNAEGSPLKYFDTKEERDAFERELKNKALIIRD